MCMLKPTATPVSPSRFRTRLGSAFLKCVSDGHAWRWRAGIFCAAFVVLLTVALHIVGATLPAGDEPWYLLQGYGIWHFHSPNLALAVRDHSIYRQFLGNLPDDHTHDFVGNGERVLAYLPGYAAIIGWLYAWGGRPLIAGTQALLAALLAVLVYDEALRLYASRGVAVFAASAYVMSLPVLVYAGEIFPTTFALVAAFVGYLLVARVLPAATGRRCILAGLSLGLIAGALLIVACLVGLLGMFLSVIVAGRINEAYAFPARFTVESSPFLALCVAGVFATGEPAFRQAVSRLAMQLRRRELLPAMWK